MSEKIKLSELRAARAAMTMGTPGSVEKYEGSGEAGILSPDGVGVAWTIAAHDAVGLVATHNAADALIELAEAILEYRTSNLLALQAREQWSEGCIKAERSIMQSLTDDPSLYLAARDTRRAAAVAKARLDAARARFEP